MGISKKNVSHCYKYLSQLLLSMKFIKLFKYFKYLTIAWYISFMSLMYFIHEPEGEDS